jgi:hypothetical protein
MKNFENKYQFFKKNSKNSKFFIFEESEDDDCYKKNCDYPEYVVPSGLIFDKDCLSVNNNLCSYLRCVSDNKLPSPAFLWKGTKLKFFDRQALSVFFDQITKAWWDWGFHKWDQVSREYYRENFIKNNINGIRWFKPPEGRPGGGVVYYTLLHWKNWTQDFNFMKQDPNIIFLYGTKQGDKIYQFPTIKDPRKKWQILLDNIEHYVYWVAMGIDYLVMVTVGGAFAFYFSIIIFTALPAIYLTKSIYEGDNIGVGINGLFMIFPYLHSMKKFLGFTEAELKEIAMAASKTPLVDASGNVIEQSP